MRQGLGLLPARRAVIVQDNPKRRRRVKPIAKPKNRMHKGKCNARTKAGGRCQHAAGHRTGHRGAGRCHIHGGKSDGAPKGNKNAKIHGLTISALRPEMLSPGESEVKAIVDAAFEGKGDLWWAKELQRSQIQICYDRMVTIARMVAEKKDPNEAFIKSADRQYKRWLHLASRLTREVPKILREIKKLGLEDREHVFTLLVNPPKGVEFVPFRAGDLPFDTRSEFLLEHARKLRDDGKLDEEADDDD